VTDFKKGTVKP